MYTHESFFVYELNNSLRLDDSSKLKILSPNIVALNQELFKKPFWGTVYRGFKMTDTQIKKYKKDKTFFWPAYSSTS